MSDDGVYVGSPYDDYDDDWDDEQGQDLADDLAQHASYSPVWQETPLGELEPYHSDWEYYSDDYYDDDPVLLRQNTLDGLPYLPRAKDIHVPHKRGKKRKLDEARDTQGLDTETQSLVKTIQGTVWAQDQGETIAWFKKGEQAKVALLTNWRDRFGQHEGAFSKGGWHKTLRDESWANDMSLAAMGLLNHQEQHNARNQDIAENDETLEDEHGIEVNDDSATSDDARQREGSGSTPPDSDVPDTKSGEFTELPVPLQPSELAVDIENKHESNGRAKRRRTQRVLPSPPTSTESSSLKAVSGHLDGKERLSSSIRATDPSNDAKSGSSSKPFQADAKQSSRENTSKHVVKGRKRKNSTDLDDDSAEQRGDTKRPRQRPVVSGTAPKIVDDSSSPPRRSRRLRKETD